MKILKDKEKIPRISPESLRVGGNESENNLSFYLVDEIDIDSEISEMYEPPDSPYTESSYHSPMWSLGRVLFEIMAIEKPVYDKEKLDLYYDSLHNHYKYSVAYNKDMIITVERLININKDQRPNPKSILNLDFILNYLAKVPNYKLNKGKPLSRYADEYVEDEEKKKVGKGGQGEVTRVKGKYNQ